ACSDDGEPIRRELIRRRAATQLALRKRLERAQREGDLPASADGATLAFFVMTVSQGMAVQAKTGASMKAPEERGFCAAAARKPQCFETYIC
ncbi:MAG TPA: hypothetical protein PJ988_03110, partial [Anaerolinea sp.]|nr:hypothetical protein [Anaerolinea sp.]